MLRQIVSCLSVMSLEIPYIDVEVVGYFCYQLLSQENHSYRSVATIPGQFQCCWRERNSGVTRLCWSLYQEKKPWVIWSDLVESEWLIILTLVFVVSNKHQSPHYWPWGPSDVHAPIAIHIAMGHFHGNVSRETAAETRTITIINTVGAAS